MGWKKLVVVLVIVIISALVIGIPKNPRLVWQADIQVAASAQIECINPSLDSASLVIETPALTNEQIIPAAGSAIVFLSDFTENQLVTTKLLQKDISQVARCWKVDFRPESISNDLTPIERSPESEIILPINTFNNINNTVQFTNLTGIEDSSFAYAEFKIYTKDGERISTPALKNITASSATKINLSEQVGPDFQGSIRLVSNTSLSPRIVRLSSNEQVAIITASALRELSTTTTTILSRERSTVLQNTSLAASAITSSSSSAYTSSSSAASTSSSSVSSSSTTTSSTTTTLPPTATATRTYTPSKTPTRTVPITTTTITLPPTATATRTYTPSKTPTRTVPITTTTITLPPTVTATRTYTPYRTPTRTPTSTISSSTTTTTVFSCPSSGELACRLGTANWCCADRKACGLTAGSCISTPCGATLQACNPPNSTISLCCPIGQVCGSTTSCTCPGPNCNILNTTLGIRQHWCCNAGEICSNTTYGTCAFLNCPTNQVSCGGACCDTSDQNSNGRPDHICVYDNVQKKGVCKGEGNACPDPVAGGGSVFCKYYNNQALCCNPDEVCDPNPNTPKRCYPSGTFPCKGTGLPDGIGCPNGYICEPRIYKPPTFTSPCMEPSYTYCGKNASNGPVMCPLGKTCIPGPPALCGGTP